MTAPAQWFGSLSTLGKVTATAAGGAGVAGAVYGLGGDRVQTPTNMARRRLQSWLRRRLRGSTRQQITRLLGNLRKRLAWSNIRARLAALRKYFTRSYWREWAESRRELATREGLTTFVVKTLQSYRKRQWRGWLRSRLRGGLNAASGGLLTTLSPAWLAPVSGPVATAASVVLSEIQRWLEDIVMGKFDAVSKRYSRVVLQGSALVTTATDRLWHLVTGEDRSSATWSVSSITSEYAEALAEVGIESVDQLAEADPDHLANTLEVDESAVEGWVDQAQRWGTKSDRPPLMETRNGKRVRQTVDRVGRALEPRVSRAVARTADAVDTAVETLRVSATTAQTWLREECLPAVSASVERLSSVLDRIAARGVARARSSLHRLGVWSGVEVVELESDLQSIEGIGPAYSERLVDIGIRRRSELATRDPEQVGAAIEVSPKRVRRWVARAESVQSDTHQLRRRVVVGVLKTEAAVARIRTPNPVPLALVVETQAWAALEIREEVDVTALSTVGIESIQQLSAVDSDRLATALGRENAAVADWVETARRYQAQMIDPAPDR